MKLPENIGRVVDFFSRLPGVGEKTATRQTLMLTRWPSEELKKFGTLISNLSSMGRCQRCFFFCEGGLCSICSNTSRRESKELCIVESVVDLLAIEKSDRYGGSYHILGGVLNPLLGIGPRELHLDDMIQRIRQERVENIIVAINPSVEGDATASYIRDILPSEVKVERIGLGIPIGGHLEYLDSLTIGKALENKKMM